MGDLFRGRIPLSSARTQEVRLELMKTGVPSLGALSEQPPGPQCLFALSCNGSCLPFCEHTQTEYILLLLRLSVVIWSVRESK